MEEVGCWGCFVSLFWFSVLAFSCFLFFFFFFSFFFNLELLREDAGS